MLKTVIKIVEDGQFMVYKIMDQDDVVRFVPDSVSNYHRQMIDEFVADGGTITEEEMEK